MGICSGSIQRYVCKATISNAFLYVRRMLHNKIKFKVKHSVTVLKPGLFVFYVVKCTLQPDPMLIIVIIWEAQAHWLHLNNNTAFGLTIEREIILWDIWSTYCEAVTQWNVIYLTPGIKYSLKDNLKWRESLVPVCLPFIKGYRSVQVIFPYMIAPKGKDKARWSARIMVFWYSLLLSALLIFLSIR